MTLTKGLSDLFELILNNVNIGEPWKIRIPRIAELLITAKIIIKLRNLSQSASMPQARNSLYKLIAAHSLIYLARKYNSREDWFRNQQKKRRRG